MSDTSISAPPRAPHRLPALPETIGVLTTEQSRALDKRYPESMSTLEDCITCHGTKEFRWFHEGNVVTFDCNCREQYRLARWLWHCGILKRYQRLGWRDVDQSLVQAIEIPVSDYITHLDAYRENGIGLVLSGPLGTGKTLLAHLILKDIVAKGVDVYATSFTAMIDEFAEGWRSSEQSRWFNARIRGTGVLFIDDLGRERTKTVGDNMLETVIRHRVACQLPTIITTNITHEDLGTAYGGHTVSLLDECSIRIEVPGSDSRSRMQQREIDMIKQGLTRPVML